MKNRKMAVSMKLATGIAFTIIAAVLFINVAIYMATTIQQLQTKHYIFIVVAMLLAAFADALMTSANKEMVRTLYNVR
jgi:flagellar biosynthesis protein FliQ